tara:strand:- start:339 stop:1274 length:936 start_codon:yes stop_codon:yes gene_type:complete
MKIISIFYILLLCAVSSVRADISNEIIALNKVSEKTSKFVSGLISEWTALPGEGLTEVDISIRDNNLARGQRGGDSIFQFSILGVRDITPKENSNLFTQFSLHNQEINNSQRIIGNIGLGYRFLNADQSMMFGANTFYDQDIKEGHRRVSLGLEAKAAILDFNYNIYQEASNQITVGNTVEKILSGQEYNISSQIPYMPWAEFNYQGYRWENEKSDQDNKGNIYSLETALSPSVLFTAEKDVSSVDGQDNINNYKLTFIHPPRSNKPSLLDGLVAQKAFAKKDMQASLKDKVRRNNNLAVEIQGSIIFTSK